ncbi:Forkhead box protein L1 [Rhizoctonia solani]|uniref:Forkhead box protein L1 n=1 Tax=Rhizoctonia solani TaxID=456999 RepID=A0A0K6FNJ1_9AGAM|nr:Forkhead box protein L1 [Rhizoctonia solani]
MSYPPTSLPPAQPYRPNQAHVARHVSQTQRHHPYRDTSRGPTDPPDGHDAYRYEERPTGTYDQYNGGSPSYQAQSPLPGRPHPPPPQPQEYPPSAGTSPHTPAQHPGHPHPPAPPHPAYHEVPQPGYHPPPSTLYSASTYGNLNGQGLDPAELPNDLSALADAHPGQKPPYPYSTIIRYAIQGSPRQRLTLSELYETMEARFPWFKTAGSGWKNSVRHNLSLNRCFEKVPRPITEPGKGSYWTVNLNGPEGTRRVRKRRSKKAKAEEGANDAGSQGPSATDTASPSAPTPSPPPQAPGTNGSPLPPPGQNGQQNGNYPPSWANDERWQQPPPPQQQPPPAQNGYLAYPPPDNYSNPANPAIFNRQPPGQGYPQQQPPQQRQMATGSSWPHQPAAPPAWPRPRTDATASQTPVPPAYPPPPPPTNNGQRPLSSAAQSDASG